MLAHVSWAIGTQDPWGSEPRYELRTGSYAMNEPPGAGNVPNLWENAVNSSGVAARGRVSRATASAPITTTAATSHTRRERNGEAPAASGAGVACAVSITVFTR